MDEILATGEREDIIRVTITVTGVVQGVGFRPFVFKAAQRFGISGFVRNEGGRVFIDASGRPADVGRFIREIKINPPPLSSVERVEVRLEKTKIEYKGFSVVESRGVPGEGPGIPPDSALCEKCRRELLDPEDRRYLYPFINCTDCGPRFTIVESSPYDRSRTSMREFEMCPECKAEYSDPSTRRFHAEPNACWVCGPAASYLDREEGAGVRDDSAPEPGSWLPRARRALSHGKILAIKGVGGYHLACDATNRLAVETLRKRKGRPAKPFAVMLKDIQTVRKWFYLDPKEEELLISAAAPIVILRAKENCPLAKEVAPGLFHYGVMLPYSPLHLLLFAESENGTGLEALIMTSGNPSGFPLVFQDEEALEELGEIVDGFVTHNRRIVRPCDDSVVRVVDGEPLFYRRSRGYVPGEIPVPFKSQLHVLGAGGEGKNTFCILSQGSARLSQHVGDLYSEECLTRYAILLKDFTQLYGFEPEILAVDTHPDYAVSKTAQRIYPSVPVYRVQHHHAHMAAVMGEHGLIGEVTGVILDGTGYGTDGGIWGGEILYGGYGGFERSFHLSYVRMPGGERAILEPWRMALSYLKKCFGEDVLAVALKLLPGVEEKVRALLPSLEWEGYPVTSSAGRLFDAVSALTGISLRSTYDGESAGLLGEAALKAYTGTRWTDNPETVLESILKKVHVSFEWKSVREFYAGEKEREGRNPVNEIETSFLIRDVVDGVMSGKPKELIALEFHRDLAGLLALYACRVCKERGTQDVVLSGGVFQNPLLLKFMIIFLRHLGLQPLWPHLLPPNDGGISYGQALVAAYSRGPTVGPGESSCLGKPDVSVR